MLDIVSRPDWEALPPAADIEPMRHPVENVVYTHNLDAKKCETDEECMAVVQGLQKKHMEEGAPDILYNFLIGGNGKVYEGRGWWFQPDKSLRFTDLHGERVDIAFIGNFGTFEELPLKQKCAASLFVQSGVDYLYLKPDHSSDGGQEFDCTPKEVEH